MHISEIDRVSCIEFVQKYHYSKVMPVLTKHYLGLFRGDDTKYFFPRPALIGALTLGWGTQPKATIKKILPNQNFDTTHYFEIGKMCIHPDLQGENVKNIGTQFLSLVVKWIKENTTVDFLYTLADGIVGKVGYVYQAFNFYYGGYFKTCSYMGPTGEKIHPRTSRWLCVENKKFNKDDKKVTWLTPEFMRFKDIKKIEGRMFRYMKPLNKKAKKIIDSYSDPNKYPYWRFQKENPKAKDLIWRQQIEKGKYVVLDEMPKFCLDVSIVNKKNVDKHKK